MRRADSILSHKKLHENDIDTIRQLAAVLEADDSPISARRMAKSLQVMADKEVTDHPRDIVRRRLIERMPRLLWFTDDDRNLLTTYDLSAVANEPPAALANLASLAGLDLIAVHDAIQAGDYALKETLLRKANTRLLNQFRGAWTQSKVSVQLATDEQNLSGPFCKFVRGQGRCSDQALGSAR